MRGNENVARSCEMHRVFNRGKSARHKVDGHVALGLRGGVRFRLGQLDGRGALEFGDRERGLGGGDPRLRGDAPLPVALQRRDAALERMQLGGDHARGTELAVDRFEEEVDHGPVQRLHGVAIPRDVVRRKVRVEAGVLEVVA